MMNNMTFPTLWNITRTVGKLPGDTSLENESYKSVRGIPLILSIYVIIFLIGLTGNSLVFLVVWKVKSVSMVTTCLTVNLAMADLLMIILSPLFVLDPILDGINFGVIGCKLQIYTWDVLYGASCFTLICIAAERYYAVCRPMKFAHFKSHLKYIIIAIWVGSSVVFCPMLWACRIKAVSRKDQTKLTCNCYSWWPKSYYYTMYGMGLVLLLYVMPMVIMLFCYVPIIHSLRKPSPVTRPNKNMKTIIKTTASIMVAFFLLWTPYNVLYTLKRLKVDFRSSYGIVWYTALVLAFLSNCINPILYTLTNKKFREATIATIKYRKTKVLHVNKAAKGEERSSRTIQSSTTSLAW